MPAKINDLSGREFGLLIAVRKVLSVKRRTMWLCRCQCGVEVKVRKSVLLAGKRRFCDHTKHPADVKKVVYPPKVPRVRVMSETDRLRRAWHAMLWRCRGSDEHTAKYYSGRGISVCDRWVGSFTAFVEDMGPRPSPEYTLDRIDTNGNYEPGNCRWATMKEQMRNRRWAVWVEWRGERRRLADVSEEMGIKNGVVNLRLRAGWELERALTMPVRARVVSG